MFCFVMEQICESIVSEKQISTPGRIDSLNILMLCDFPSKFSSAFWHKTKSSIDNGSLSLKKYEVPFLIWANYDITEKEIDHISLNYLSTEMAVDTGQSMSAYQCFLQAMQQEISSLSDNGCYDAEGRYYTLEEAPESMQQWIREYKILQYYMLFDGQES